MGERREIGWASAVGLVIANMVGTGIFTTSGFLLQDLRSPWAVLFIWLAGGVIASLGAICYGALGRRIPESGGEYRFLHQTLHPSAGYLAGWVSFLVGFSAPLAAAAFAFGEYLAPWLPAAWLAPKLLGTLLILVFTAVHGFRVRSGTRIQDVIVWAKLAGLMAFVLFALPRLKGSNAEWPPPETGIGVYGVSLVWVLFSYSGWNAAVYLAGEIRDAELNLPRALLWGTGIVTVFYLLLNGVFVFSAPVDQLAGQVDIGRVAAESLGGKGWGTGVTFLILLALMSSVSSMVMTGPRVYAQMARDGYLPQWMHAVEGPPRISIGFQSLAALGILWTATFEGLLTYIGFTLGLSTAATVFGLIRLKRREGDTFRVPGWPWVPWIFVASILAVTGATLYQQPIGAWAGLFTMALGLIAWRLSKRK